MSRAPRARQPDVAERVKLFAEHHIVAVRTGRRNGEIIAVKHATYGWISPKAFYGLQKVHDVLPLVEKVVEGGYRVNALIWGFNPNIDIAGISILIPAGAALLATSIWNLYQELTALQAGQPHWARLAYVSAEVFAPFGAVLQVLDTIEAALDPTNPLIPAQLKPSAWAELYNAAHPARPPIRPLAPREFV